MALSDTEVEVIHFKEFGYVATGLGQFARAIEAEVRKDYEALIRQMLEALEFEWGGELSNGLIWEPIPAARARLLDSDLSNLTERGAAAWAGVDAQKLREDGTT